MAVGFLKRLRRTLGRFQTPSMRRMEVIRFSVIAYEGKVEGHDALETTGQINTDFDNHLKSCPSCQATIIKDMKDFIEQMEKEWS